MPEQIIRWPKVNSNKFVTCTACGRPNAIGMSTCLFCGLDLSKKMDDANQKKKKHRSRQFVDAGARDRYESQEKVFPAPVSSRIAAFIIDRVILMAIVIPMGVKKGVIAIGSGILPLADHFPTVPQSKVISLIVFALVVDFILNMAGEISGMQGTLGKHFMGLRTCDARGQNIGIGNSAVRYLVKTLSSLALIPLAAVLDDRKQAPHDKVADSFVVHS